MVDQDTIFALSSGQLPAAIAVIRISGPKATDAARALTDGPLPPPRQAGLRRLFHPQDHELLDEALLICFPGPRTETGEDQVELHCHGSRAVVQAVEDALAEMPTLRRAGPGEFTRRAFLNGKIDLAGIEGLGDLVAAETVLQRRAAMAMFGGALSRKIADWTLQLRRAAAQIEAQLDFSDEGDVTTGAEGLANIVQQATSVAAEISQELAKPTSSRLKDGIRVAIGGPPNAGKSSLFNMLVGRDAAIVSPHAGTTRDVIEATISIRGIPFLLSDSAGLHVTDEEIEKIGIGRAEALLSQADIVLWLGESDHLPQSEGVIVQLIPKSDIADRDRIGGIAVSSVTGEGIEFLVDKLCTLSQSLLPAPGDYALSERQYAVMRRAVESLAMVEDVQDEILIGECLRQTLSALDELTGFSTTEAMLDELFSGFCIGK